MLGVLLITMAEIGAPVEMELLIADFEGRPIPRLVGENLPEGSSVQVSEELAWRGMRSCKLHYRYPGVAGISYAGMGFVGPGQPLAGEPMEFRVWVRGDGVGETLRVRLRDASGQCHQYNLGVLNFTGWRQISCSLQADQGHWGGANDGKLHLPVVFDSLIVDSDIEPAESEVYFDDLSYVTTAEPHHALQVETASEWFGNVAFVPKNPELTLIVRNRRLDGMVDTTLEAIAKNSRGEEVARQEQHVSLAPRESKEFSLRPRQEVRGLIHVAIRAGETTLHQGRQAVLPQPHPLKKAEDPFFGVCTHFGQNKHVIPESLQLMRRVGVEFLRDELYWGAIERKRGEFRFPERYDAYMKAAAAAGIHVLIVTTYANELYDGGQAPHTDEGRTAYARYVTELMKRYGNICQRWEIWNEPNIGFWRGRKPDPAEYFELLKTTYLAVKQADPEGTVIGVCTAGTDWRFIEGVLKLGGGQYMDALSTHPYRYPRSPEESGFVKELERTYELMKQYGMEGKKLWLTEIGWPTQRDERGVDEQTSANYLVRMYVLARSQPYVAGVAWYDWQDDGPDPTYNEHNFGMTKWETSEAKAALVAYHVLTRYLSHTNLEQQLLPATDRDNRYLFLFRRGKEMVLVGWATQPEQMVSVSLGCNKVQLQWADARVEQRNLVGGVLSLPVGEMPVFVTGSFERVQLSASMTNMAKSCGKMCTPLLDATAGLMFPL